MWVQMAEISQRQMIDRGESGNMAEAECKKCYQAINENADRCPHCGYEPRSMGWRMPALVALGAGLCLTGIGIPFGIAVFYGVYKAETEMKEWKPSNHSA